MSDKARFRPTERFSGLADIYAAARPSYPQAAIEFILSHCQLSEGAKLADIGCGTGISSRLFSKRGIQVVGIEPNSDMRERAHRAEPSSVRGNIEYRSGTGEQTLLEATSVDAVLSAQAFHWLEAEEALAEFHRILKPSGWVILMWNERDESDRFTAKYGEIIRTQKEANAVEMQRGETAGRPLLDSKLFRQATVRKFPNEQVVNEEGLIMRACSASYTPKEGEPLKLMKRQLSAVFHQFAVGDCTAIKYETLVFTGQRQG